MAIKNFFGKILKKETQADTHYLSLTLTPDRVLATIWTFEQEKVQILGFAKKSFQNIDSVIHQAAVVIDTAAEKAKSDVSEVVFALSSNWFEDKQMKKDTSKLLKKLSEDLELSAQAFIPLSSSIKNFLKVQESVTPKAILVGIFDEFFEIYLVRNNEVEAFKTSSSKASVEKISQLVKQLDDEGNLPSRIVVYGINDQSKLAEEISRFKWEETFAHLPKIEFLTDNQISQSVAYAQATDILGHELSLAPVAAAVALSAEGEEVEGASQEKPQANELGFIEGEDILKTQATTEPKFPEDQVEQKTAEPEVGTRIAQAQKQDFALDVDQNVGEPESQLVQDEMVKKEKGGLVEGIVTLGWFSKILNIFKGRSGTKKLIIGLGIILVVGLISLFVAGQKLTSAEIVIKVNAKSQEDSFDVDVSGGGSSNFAKQQIAGRAVSSTASGSRKAVATGTKKLGEYAKGEVTIINWTTSQTLFSKSTVIISKNGIKFGLDNDVQVASRSASTPGQDNVVVTAVDFGPEGNVGAGSDFTFQEFVELLYSATNDLAFTGGDEKEVTIVSQEDLEKLAKSLLETLEENAIADLLENTSGQKIHEETVEIEVTKEIFDKDLEKEASLVNLDLEIEATAVAYDEQNLKELLAENTKEDAPESLEAKADNIEILNLTAQSLGSKLNLTGKFQASFIPKFDENKLKEKIAGKSVKEVREIIKELPEVSDVNVNFSPNFFFVSTVSKNQEKISLKVES